MLRHIIPIARNVIIFLLVFGIIALIGAYLYIESSFSLSGNYTQRFSDMTTTATEGPQSAGSQVVNLAFQEYVANISETRPGCNCGERVLEYTNNQQQPWSASFVSWVFWQAQSPFTGGPAGAEWLLGDPAAIRSYAESKGAWLTLAELQAEGLELAEGDLLVYTNKVEIVLLDRGAGQADIIGGDLTDRVDLVPNQEYADTESFQGIIQVDKLTVPAPAPVETPVVEE